MKQNPNNEQGTALETVIIFTTKMETLAQFYQEAFDLGEVNLSPGHIGMQVGSVYLGFDQMEEDMDVGGVTLWFTVDDIQAKFDRLVAMGAKVRYPPSQKPWGGFLAALYDPDGNMIGLSQRS
jgi:predicted enzyme related to lactoylglutathione lyase